MAMMIRFLLLISGLLVSFFSTAADDLSPASSSLLSSYHVSTNVTSRLAKTTIAMVFENPANCSSIHALTLQLPRDARLTELVMDLSDGCQLDSQVKSLEAAKDDFTNSASQGKAAAMVTAWDASNYGLKVSIPPTGKTNVLLKYQQLLSQKLDRVQFQIPFHPGTAITKELKMDISVEESDTGIREFQTDDLDVDDETIEINFGEKISLAHYESNNLQMLNVDNSLLFPRLLGASYRPGPLPEDGLFLSDGECFTHLFNPSTFLGSAGSMARRIVFVIDVSGSMGGAKLEDAKAAFAAMIDTLDDRDELIVQPFSDKGTEDLWGPSPATLNNKESAKGFVENLSTIGGTNLNGALLDGIALVSDAPEEAVSVLVLLTDGQGSLTPREIARNVRTVNEGSKVKIFSLAFGEDADMDLLLAIAIQNGGRAVRVYEGYGDAVYQMNSFFQQELGRILLSDIDVLYDFDGAKEITTPHFPVLSGGSEIVVRGKFGVDNIPTKFKSTVSAKSAVGAKEWLSEFVTLPAVALDANNDCRQSFAQARVEELLEYRDAERAIGGEELTNTINKLSNAYSFSALSFEKQAQQIALDAQLVWPGLTALVTIENASCQQNASEVCYSGEGGREGVGEEVRGAKMDVMDDDLVGMNDAADSGGRSSASPGGGYYSAGSNHRNGWMMSLLASAVFCINFFGI